MGHETSLVEHLVERHMGRYVVFAAFNWVLLLIDDYRMVGLISCCVSHLTIVQIRGL